MFEVYIYELNKVGKVQITGNTTAFFSLLNCFYYSIYTKSRYPGYPYHAMTSARSCIANADNPC